MGNRKLGTTEEESSLYMNYLAVAVLPSTNVGVKNTSFYNNYSLFGENTASRGYPVQIICQKSISLKFEIYTHFSSSSVFGSYLPEHHSRGKYTAEQPKHVYYRFNIFFSVLVSIFTHFITSTFFFQISTQKQSFVHA